MSLGDDRAAWRGGVAQRRCGRGDRAVRGDAHRPDGLTSRTHGRPGANALGGTGPGAADLGQPEPAAPPPPPRRLRRRSLHRPRRTPRGRRERGAEARGEVADRHRRRAAAEVAVAARSSRSSSTAPAPRASRCARPAGRGRRSRTRSRRRGAAPTARASPAAPPGAAGSPAGTGGTHPSARPRRPPRVSGGARASAGRRADEHRGVHERRDGEGEEHDVAPARVDGPPPSIAIQPSRAPIAAEARRCRPRAGRPDRAEPSAARRPRPTRRLEALEPRRHRVRVVLDLVPELRQPLGSRRRGRCRRPRQPTSPTP